MRLQECEYFWRRLAREVQSIAFITIAKFQRSPFVFYAVILLAGQCLVACNLGTGVLDFSQVVSKLEGCETCTAYLVGCHYLISRFFTESHRYQFIQFLDVAGLTAYHFICLLHKLLKTFQLFGLGGESFHFIPSCQALFCVTTAHYIIRPIFQTLPGVALIVPEFFSTGNGKTCRTSDG